MAKYELLQDIKSPMGCVDKGTISEKFDNVYVFFRYNGFKGKPIALGNGLVMWSKELDILYPEWFKKIKK